MFESGRHGRLFQLVIIRLFELRRRHVPDRLEQPTVVKPIDPLQDRILDGVGVRQGPRRRMTSVLYNPLIVSARALS